MRRGSWLALLSALVLCACGEPEGGGKGPRGPVRHEPAEPRIPEGPTVEHTLRFPAPHTHYVEVESIFPAGGDALEISMAVWTPGSYLVREYSRHVEDFRASTVDGAPLTARKVRKNRWRIDAGGAERVVVRYRLYAREMTVRTNFVDADLAVLNGAPTFFRVADDAERAHDVLLELPEGWAHAVTGLRAHEDGKPAHFVAANYDELVDSPIVAGTPKLSELTVEGAPHLLAHFGELSAWDVDKSARDVATLAREQIRFWGVIPYERYVFLNLAVGGGGGLEHLDSTLLVIGPLATQSEDDYHDWLGLVSHEFFHTWNIKRLRPKELGPFDYENENYTRSLWIAEGITSYYDDLFLRRAGLIDRDTYLERLSKNIERLQTRPGRAVQSLSRSSYDAWIKHYRPDENSVNTAISYYTKGAVVGFLLDAEIRRLSQGRRSLDDVMRLAYERYSGESGYTPEEFRALASEVAGADLSSFFARTVDSTEELDYQPALDFFGLELDRGDAGEAGGDEDEERAGWLGVDTRGDERIVVRRVERGTPAHAAGLNVDDEIIAIDGFRVRDLGELLKAHRPGDEVSLTIARRGTLRTLPVTLGEEPTQTFALKVVGDASIVAQKNLEAWLDDGGDDAPAP